MSIDETGTLKMATWNVQGWDWKRVDNVEKTNTIIKYIKRMGWSVVSLTELHNDNPCIVYMDDLCFILGQRAGICLDMNARAAWMKGGQHLFFVHERIMHIELVTQRGRRLLAGSFYGFTGGLAMERLKYYQALKDAHEKYEGIAQFWPGDANAHISPYDGFDGLHNGKHGLRVPATVHGKQLLKELMMTKLALADSFKHSKSRGTWQHNRTRGWYELDIFVVGSAYSRSSSHHQADNMDFDMLGALKRPREDTPLESTKKKVGSGMLSTFASEFAATANTYSLFCGSHGLPHYPLMG
eukprot:TRINITY_DN51482_c0_g1_i1.p1 TRINITY_DN51482_c0_g1~~TRINITY_DN51482_c0_g1_i1.p1  ORF type:complete len:298 (+),score=26.88 TRINITY_DN51482_c0_g1_i1:456-1349(+)